MKAKPKPTEAELAALVVAWLEQAGHDVYQEVQLGGQGSDVADIVALVGPGREVWIVEVKAGWSLDLLTQCVARREHAHRVFAATPWARVNHSDLFAALGIGTIRVAPPTIDEGDWAEPVKLCHMADKVSSDPRHGAKLRAKLRPEHKTHAKAGTQCAAGRFTPFRATCEAVTRFVVANPGATIKEVVAGIEYHYSSAGVARSSIAKWAGTNQMPNVVGKVEGGKLRLYPAERKAA